MSVTNNGTTNLLLSGVVAARDADDFTTTPFQCSRLAPTQACIFTITFRPLQTGVKTAVLTITDSSSGIEREVSLSGGTDLALTLTPTQVAFGNVPVGSISATQTVAVTTSDGAAGKCNGHVGWTLPAVDSELLPADALPTLSSLPAFDDGRTKRSGCSDGR